MARRDSSGRSSFACAPDPVDAVDDSEDPVTRVIDTDKLVDDATNEEATPVRNVRRARAATTQLWADILMRPTTPGSRCEAQSAMSAPRSGRQPTISGLPSRRR